MPTVGEEIERRKEERKLREVEEQRQAEFERQAALVAAQAEERSRRERQRRKLKQGLRVLRKAVGKSVKGKIKKQAVLAAGRAILAAIAPYVGIALLVVAVIVFAIGLTAVVVAALCSAEGTLGLTIQGISAVAGALSLPGGGWCQQAGQLTSGVAGVIGRGQGLLCENPQLLAAQYNTLYPYGDSPNLVQLMNCIEGDMGRKGFPNLGSRFTYESEKSNPLCNYTRGNPICGKCAHSVNSCHYGGPDGTRGAEAVDYGRQELAGEIIKSARFCRAGFVQTERTHVHISTQSCTGDRGDGEL